MEGLLQRVTDLVKAVMPGRSEASVTLLVQERPSTVVAAGRLAVDLDEGQYERGHGPCLHVAATRETAEIRAAAIGPSLPRTVDRRSRRSPGRSCRLSSAGARSAAGTDDWFRVSAQMRGQSHGD